MQRNRCIKVRLSDIELNTINEFVERSGYKSREHYIRTVLLKSVPKEQPNIDYQKLIFLKASSLNVSQPKPFHNY